MADDVVRVGTLDQFKTDGLTVLDIYVLSVHDDVGQKQLQGAFLNRDVLSDPRSDMTGHERDGIPNPRVVGLDRRGFMHAGQPSGANGKEQQDRQEAINLRGSRHLCTPLGGINRLRSAHRAINAPNATNNIPHPLAS